MIKRLLSSFSTIAIALLFTVTTYAANGSTIVHKTRSGECYHKANCSYLKSDYEITLQDAVDADLRPCSRCNPPKLTYDDKPSNSANYKSEKSNSSAAIASKPSISSTYKGSENIQSQHEKNTFDNKNEEPNIIVVSFAIISVVAILLGTALYLDKSSAKRETKNCSQLKAQEDSSDENVL